MVKTLAIAIVLSVTVVIYGLSYSEVGAQSCSGGKYNSDEYYCTTNADTGCKVCGQGKTETCGWVGPYCYSANMEGDYCEDYICDYCAAHNIFLSWNPDVCSVGGGPTPTPGGATPKPPKPPNVSGDHWGDSGVKTPPCRAFGWAADPDDRSTPVYVRVFADDGILNRRIVDPTRANDNDPTLTGVCTNGNCKFDFDITSQLTPDVNYKIRVEAQDLNNGEWVSLPNTEKNLTCSQPPCPNPSCASWTDFRINNCTIGQWESIPQSPTCYTPSSNVTLNLNVLYATQMQFANVGIPPQPPDASSCASYGGPWSAPQAYNSTVNWNMLGGYGDKKVCGRFTNTSCPGSTPVQCGGKITYCPTIASISLSPVNIWISSGLSTGFTAIPRDINGNQIPQYCVKRVDFSSTAGASVSPSSDTTIPYFTTATCDVGGPHTITATGYDMYGNSRSANSTLNCDCSCSVDINPISWNPFVTDTSSFVANPTVNESKGCSISNVSFTSSNGNAVSLCASGACPAGVASRVDSVPAYTTNATAYLESPPNYSITSRATMNTGASCIDVAPVTVKPLPTLPPTVTPTPTPMECNIQLTSVAPMQIGDTRWMSVQWVKKVGTPDHADFSSSNPSKVSILSPNPDISEPYVVQIRALLDGNPASNISAVVTMADGKTCSDTEPIVVQAPTCDISLSGKNPLTLLETANYTVSLNALDPPGFPIDKVEIRSSNPGAISLCSSGGACNTSSSLCATGVGLCTDTAPTYRTKATAYSVGSGTTISAHMYLAGSERCSAQIGNVGVNNADPWWQTTGGDVTAGNGQIYSKVTSACSITGCSPLLILDAIGGFPGTAGYVGSINPNVPSISSTNWNYKSPYLGDVYDYQYFVDRLPQTPKTIASVANMTGGPTSGGFELYQASGNFTIGGALSLGSRKVVLMVPGNLTINSKINVSKGLGNFIAIVQGNINVGSSVGDSFSSSPNPDLEGIYFAQGNFVTQSAGNDSDKQLMVRGTVVGMGTPGVDLRRDMPDNTKGPAEIFEFAPDLNMLFPPFFGKRGLEWREVAP